MDFPPNGPFAAGLLLLDSCHRAAFPLFSASGLVMLKCVCMCVCVCLCVCVCVCVCVCACDCSGASTPFVPPGGDRSGGHYANSGSSIPTTTLTEDSVASARKVCSQ